MPLTKKQQKYLNKNWKKTPVSALASVLKVPETEIQAYLTKKGYQKKSAVLNDPNASPLEKIIFGFSLKTWVRQQWKLLLLLSVLIIVAYFNALNNDFLSDDIDGILNNSNLDHFGYAFSTFPPTIQNFLYYLIIHFFGRNPTAFRIFNNLLFHFETVFVTYCLVWILSKPRIAFFTAALVAVHPLMVEAVSWVSAGSYPRYSFFILLGLLLYLFGIKHKKYYVFSAISFILALLSSEKALVIPFVLGALLFCYHLRKPDWKKLLLFSSPAILLAVYYARLLPDRLLWLKTQHYQETKMLNPVLQIPVAITSYIQLAIFPKGLTLYHSEMFFSPFEYVIRAVIFFAILILGYVLYRKNREIAFWLLLFIFSLLPTLTPFGVSWIVAERYVYLGAIGLYALAAYLLHRFIKTDYAYYVVLTFLIIGFTFVTISRNNDWQNQDNLWLAAAKTSPSSPNNHNNLGDYYGRHGDYAKAIEEFKTAVTLKPNYADAYHNLANTYRQVGQYDEAEKNYLTALQFNSNLWQSHQNLAAIAYDKKDYTKALEHLDAGLKISPNNTILLIGKGIIYLTLNDKANAKIYFEKTLQIDPSNERAKQGLIQASN